MAPRISSEPVDMCFETLSETGPGWRGDLQSEIGWMDCAALNAAMHMWSCDTLRLQFVVPGHGAGAHTPLCKDLKVVGVLTAHTVLNSTAPQKAMRLLSNRGSRHEYSALDTQSEHDMLQDIRHLGAPVHNNCVLQHAMVTCTLVLVTGCH
jgi:hypothetical protein